LPRRSTDPSCAYSSARRSTPLSMARLPAPAAPGGGGGGGGGGAFAATI
jgi:hypothetical protein